jgi:hypothetical protein
VAAAAVWSIGRTHLSRTMMMITQRTLGSLTVQQQLHWELSLLHIHTHTHTHTGKSDYTLARERGGFFFNFWGKRGKRKRAALQDKKNLK